MTGRDLKLHILYGVPCVGKSTTAIALAHGAGIRTVVQTDYLREVQRLYVAQDDVPALRKVTHSAWELYGPPTRHNIVRGFVAHVEAVAPAVGTVVAKLTSDGLDAVIEGAHFYGPVIRDLQQANRGANIRATLLVTRTANELRCRITRKMDARADGAVDKLWRTRLPILLAIQRFLIADARTYGIPVRTAYEWRDRVAL